MLAVFYSHLQENYKRELICGTTQAECCALVFSRVCNTVETDKAQVLFRQVPGSSQGLAPSFWHPLRSVFPHYSIGKATESTRAMFVIKSCDIHETARECGNRSQWVLSFQQFISPFIFLSFPYCLVQISSALFVPRHGHYWNLI